MTDASNLVLYYAVLRGCAIASSDAKQKSGKAPKGSNATVFVTKEWLNAQKESGLPPICLHWYRLGTCVYGPLCKFRHPPEMAAKEQRDMGISVQEKKETEYDIKKIAAERRQLFAKLTEQEVEGKKKRNRGEGRRNRIRNDSKAGCFRRWLIDTYGLDYLCRGTGILDVAGGKGELAFELLNLSGIPTTLVDPRPMDITHFKKRLLVGIYYKNIPFQIYNTRPKITKEEDVETPGHLRIFFTSTLANDNTDTTTTKSKAQILEEAYMAALKVQWTTKGLVKVAGQVEETTGEKEAEEKDEDSDDDEDHQEGSKQNSEEEERKTKEEQEDFCRTADWEAIEKTLSNASIVVGMHPDQAAEHIVDFALKTGKPFAIVPCCTYHREFPHRRRPNGQFVKTYQHLIDYLVAKDPQRIGVEVLDFEGKNKVVFLKPEFDTGGSGTVARPSYLGYYAIVSKPVFSPKLLMQKLTNITLTVFGNQTG